MKLKHFIGAGENDNENEWRDIYIKEELISSWWIPDDYVYYDENNELVAQKGISCVVGGHTYTFKHEDHLKKYLIMAFELEL